VNVGEDAEVTDRKRRREERREEERNPHFTPATSNPKDTSPDTPEPPIELQLKPHPRVLPLGHLDHPVISVCAPPPPQGYSHPRFNPLHRGGRDLGGEGEGKEKTSPEEEKKKKKKKKEKEGKRRKKKGGRGMPHSKLSSPLHTLEKGTRGEGRRNILGVFPALQKKEE